MSSLWWNSLVFLVVNFAHGSPSWSLNKIVMTGPKADALIDNSTVKMVYTSNQTEYLLLMETMAQGTQLGLQECQHQFRWDGWNCSITDSEMFHGKIEKLKANKETAFVQAINAAGVMHFVIRQCKSGQYKMCSCFLPRHKTKFKTEGNSYGWVGCSADIDFGEEFTTTMLDTMISGNDIHATMHLQNNRAGRRIIRKTSRRNCRCHGLTGACTVVTCWKETAKFREVGRYLKRKYRRAVRINNNNDDKLKNANDARTFRNSVIFGGNLVYLYNSPSYCRENTELGVTGTVGRMCSRKKKKVSFSERKSCRNLCTNCGHKVERKIEFVNSTCNCKFIWCCHIKCNPCVIKKKTFFCQA